MQTCICIGGLVLVADAGAWMLSAQTGDSRWVVLITSGTAVIVAFCTMLVMIAPHASKAGVAIVNAAFPIVQLIWRQRDELLGQTRKLQQDLAENTRITAEAQEAARKLGEEAKGAAQRNTGTIETLLEQNKKLQKTIEEDRARTEDANRKLHEIRNEFQVATLQHREQREALIAQLGALTNELAAARIEIADLREHDSRRLKGVEVLQEHQAAAITETQAAVVSTQAAVVENKVAIERIDAERSAEKSGPMPVVELPPRNDEPS
jgi:septal ring factor EnvC (AmiA/AmiB activator)